MAGANGLTGLLATATTAEATALQAFADWF